jgi:hypothetical protein
LGRYGECYLWYSETIVVLPEYMRHYNYRLKKLIDLMTEVIGSIRMQSFD